MSLGYKSPDYNAINTENSDTSLTPSPPSDANIQLALQTLINSRNNHTPPLPTLSVRIPSDASAFARCNDHIGIEMSEPLSPIKTAMRPIEYNLHDTTKHSPPIKINVFQNPTIAYENEIELDEYTHIHEPITHNRELLQYSRAKSLSQIHSADIDNMCIRSNSPALISKNNSNNNSFYEEPIYTNNAGGGNSSGSSDAEGVAHDYNSDFDNHSQLLHPPTSDVFAEYAPAKHSVVSARKRDAPASRKKYKKLTYDDVAKSLSHYYDDYNKYSNEMDVLITFIRGQKHLFLQSANVTSFKLYSMLFLALCITAFITVVTPFIHDYKWNTILVTSCNACATVVITMTRYWKFELSNNAYSFLCNNYDKLEHSLEIANNKLTFMDNEHDQNKIVLEKIKEMEFKIGEMKDVFQVSIPQEVVMLFPVVSHVNIFSFIKKMETHKRHLIFKYRDIKNEINYYLYRLNQPNPAALEMDENAYTVEKRRILYLNDIKDKIKSELINYKDAYNQIDILFTKEIQFAEKHVNTVYALPLYLWWFGKPSYLNVDNYSNPVIKDYLHLIISGD